MLEAVPSAPLHDYAIKHLVRIQWKLVAELRSDARECERPLMSHDEFVKELCARLGSGEPKLSEVRGRAINSIHDHEVWPR